MIRNWKWIVSVFFIMAFPVFAEEVAKGDQPSILITILHHISDFVLAILTLLFGLAFKWMTGKAGQNEARVAAIEALKGAVEIADQKLVAKFKKASKDGILSPEEKAQLREFVMKKALEIAKGPAKDLLIDWGKEIIMAKIREIVDSRNKAKAEKVVLPTAEEIK